MPELFIDTMTGDIIDRMTAWMILYRTHLPYDGNSNVPPDNPKNDSEADFKKFFDEFSKNTKHNDTMYNYEPIFLDVLRAHIG